jgi:hypothetical protein
MADAQDLKELLKAGKLPDEIVSQLADPPEVLRLPTAAISPKAERTEGYALSDWDGVERLKKQGFMVRKIHTHIINDDKGNEVAAFAWVACSRP